MTYRLGVETKPPIKELRKALVTIDKGLPKALNAALKAGAEVVSSDARGRASTPQQARAARQIKPSGTAKGASVTLTASKGVPFAVAAFLGMNRRTGWYAKDKYGASAGRQALPWIGSGWKVGGTGGPAAINPAIAAKQEEMLKRVGDEIARVFKPFFGPPT